MQKLAEIDGLTYCFVDESNIDEQVSLFNSVMNATMTPAAWKRKHIEGPLVKQWTLVGVFDGTKLIGTNGFSPIEYEYNGRIFKGFESSDTTVNPEYRGRHIMSNMLNCARDYFTENGFDIIVGHPNRNSFEGFLKVGYDLVSKPVKYFYPFNVKNVAKDMLGKNLPKFLDPIGEIWRLMHSHNAKGLHIEEIKNVTAKECAFFFDANKIHLHVTDEYAKWKTSSGCTLYKVFRGNELVAQMMICDFVAGDDYVRGNVLGTESCNGSDKDYAAAWSLLVKKLKKKYDLLCIYASSEKDNTKVYKKAGFLRSPDAEFGSPFICNVLTDDPEKREILKKAELWGPVFMDVDYILDYNL